MSKFSREPAKPFYDVGAGIKFKSGDDFDCGKIKCIRATWVESKAPPLIEYHVWTHEWIMERDVVGFVVESE